MTNPKHTDTSRMTEAEALDMAAKAAGWLDWDDARQLAECGEIEIIRAHAKTIVAMAELMTTCEEATTRMELMYLQHRKVVDENAALKAENEALKALRDDDGELLTIAWMDGAHSAKKAQREHIAALKAENERLREALETIVNNCGQCGGYGTYPEEEIITGKVLWSDCSSPQCQEARAALKEIDNGDR